MTKIVRMNYCVDTKKRLLIFCLAVFLGSQLLCLQYTKAQNYLQKDSLQHKIELRLNDQKQNSDLNFAIALKKFYEKNDYKPYWLTKERDIKQTYEAMRMLDCLGHYGLSPQNFHNKILNYNLMHEVYDEQNLANDLKRVQFEILLSDALLTLINHLHFGRFNPNINPKTIMESDFAINTLLNALNSKDFVTEIESVQPKTSMYHQLQRYLRLAVGQYNCESYEIADTTVVKIMINLERLRWMEWENELLHINIPSYTLTYKTADSSSTFKVIVGTKQSPTAQLQSFITHFNSSPYWRIPKSIFINELIPKALKDTLYFKKNKITVYDNLLNPMEINSNSLKLMQKNLKQYQAVQNSGYNNPLGKLVFRFKNKEDIYLHDTPDQHLFKNNNRALSHGCIRVQNAEKLAQLILTAQNLDDEIKNLKQAIKNNTQKQFNLAKKIPVNISYLTCLIIDEMLVQYPDIYQLDQNLIEKINSNH